MMDFSFLENPEVGAIASKIERTRCGDFVMEDSVSLDTPLICRIRETSKNCSSGRSASRECDSKT